MSVGMHMDLHGRAQSHHDAELCRYFISLHVLQVKLNK